VVAATIQARAVAGHQGRQRRAAVDNVFAGSDVDIEKSPTPGPVTAVRLAVYRAPAARGDEEAIRLDHYGILSRAVARAENTRRRKASFTHPVWDMQSVICGGVAGVIAVEQTRCDLPVALADRLAA